MISVDTNILARLLLEDDAVQMRQAQAVIDSALETEGGLLIPSCVFIELAWLLRTEGYSRAEIYTGLRSVLRLRGAIIAQREIIENALALYRHGKADFPDYFILVESKQAGAKKLASFDRVLCKEQSFARLPQAL